MTHVEAIHYAKQVTQTSMHPANEKRVLHELQVAYLLARTKAKQDKVLETFKIIARQGLEY